MTKYLAAILNLVALVVLGIVVVAVIRPEPTRRLPALAGSATAADSSAANGQALAKLQSLEGAIATIGYLRNGGTIGEAPLAVGVEPPAPVAVGARQPGAEKAPAVAEPVVSLIYVSQEMTRAVVNGQMVTVGDSLPGQARIVAIDADKVVIESKGRRSTLSVAKPHIVGGLLKQQEGAK